MTTYLAATGTALPNDPIGNDTMAEHFGTSAAWIEAFIGTRQRYLAVELATGRVTHTLADLGAQAGGQALARAGLEPHDVDFVVLSTATPDHLMPATVNLVAEALGIHEVPTYQLQSGCAGAVAALQVAAAIVESTGRTGLVIGADSCSKHLVARDFAALSAPELVNYVIFGDGAGAVVITPDEVRPCMVLRLVVNDFVGLGCPPGQVVNWFNVAGAGTGEQAVHEDYKAIERRVPPMAKDVLRLLLEGTGWSMADLAYLLPPQLSGRMTASIVKALGVDAAEEVSCVADTGNNANALPFVQLDLLAQRIRPGQRALGIAIESSKWIRTGFAVEGV
ncbi:MAG TPA: 3-oxoacyl-ACP synthase III family protein [Pseudonocardiaceae bacterium]